MNNEIRRILEAVRSGGMSVDDALLKIKKEPFEDIGFAKVDLHRKIRQGAAEVVYGAGKTPEQIIGILDVMKSHGQDRVLITRLSAESAERVAEAHPVDYYREARVGIIGGFPKPDGIGRIVVATGGTSDIPVAEEAALTAQVLGARPSGRYHGRQCHYRHRGDGGSPGQRHRGPGGLPGDRGADKRRLRRVLRRAFSSSVHAEFLRQRRVGGEY